MRFNHKKLFMEKPTEEMVFTNLYHGIHADPDFFQPPKILGKPPTRTKDKYCAFHEANVHNTKGSIAL